MKTSLNFIKDFVDINLSEEELEKLISLNVIEVEGMEKLVSATNLTIGKVLECEMHPDSDHLHVCKVDLGTKIEQIVCGAPNCRKGIKVIVAMVGAVLPGDFKIKSSKVRGIESNGMLCSLQELGLPETFVPKQFKDGIFIFDDDAEVGDNTLKVLGLDDLVIDLGLTPNRGDLLSHLGIAYDIAAASKKEVNYQAPIVKNARKSDISVKIETNDCKAYYARKIKNVVVKESPWWMKSRLMACGVRPINNVVDITNYVMLELGQPLHAFDAKILGNSIVVRNANLNEEMVTLDEVKRELTINDILITDGKKGVALGGVMGGLNSSINENTTELVLESAVFDPISIRRTSARLNLRSEASTRFERKVDPNRVLLALDRASFLLSELADADIDDAYVCVDNLNKQPKEININVDRINKYLGINLTANEVENIFLALGFDVDKDKENLKVTVPTRRVDIDNYQDLMEEVARIYGFDNIKSTIPVTDSKGYLTNYQKKIRTLRHSLANLGFNETINYSLINKNDTNKFGEFTNNVSLLMPMTEEREMLRQTLINSVVDVLNYNKARQISDLAIFEIGRGYTLEKEETLLSIAMMGKFACSLWQGVKLEADFYLLKGVTDYVLSLFGYQAEYIKATNNGLHNGQTANIFVEGKKIGIIGAIHPNVQKEKDLDKAYVMEINLDILFSIENKKFIYQSTPKYPCVARDIAIVIDRKIEAKDIIALVKQTGKKILVETNIFDVYEGDKIDNNLKSVAISLVFRDNEKTLTSEDVDKAVNSILKRLDFTYQAKLRS